MAEVEKLKLEGPTTEDLNKVKESKLQSYREASKTNRFWLSNLTTSMEEDSVLKKF
jgi:zinc protease